eukprot:TRINITY_DN33197_c0_g1_i1.p1 TRINITY_DN33197_c0_g1~~TRINITY_DN33197_c0_g1_i1.p1  ORF type:complete len:677 (-),score=102.23 TRINITY_DN33197_c0_g1_i1:325-2355(-)
MCWYGIKAFGYQETWVTCKPQYIFLAMAVLGTESAANAGRLSGSPSSSPDAKATKTQETPDAKMHKSSDASVEKQADENKSRVRDNINPEIQDILKMKKTPLMFKDFDLKAKQCLHAIHGKGGRASVREALHLVADWSAKKNGRDSVQNWSAYIGAILWRYLDKFEADIRAGEDGGVYVVQWKKPPTAKASGVDTSDDADRPSEDLKSKKWYRNLFGETGADDTYDKTNGKNWWKQKAESHGAWNSLDAKDATWWTGYCSPTGKWNVRDVKQSQKNWMSTWTEVESRASYKAKDGSRRSIAGTRASRKSIAQQTSREEHDALGKKKGRESFAGPDTTSRSARRKARQSWAPVADVETATSDERRNPRRSWAPGVSQNPPAAASASPSPASPQEAKERRRGKGVGQKTSQSCELSTQTVEQEISSWAASRLSPAVDVRLLSLSPTETPALHTASILFCSMEVLVDVEAASESGLVVLDARTHTPWPTFQHAIGMALETTKGLGFSEFLDAVSRAWPHTDEQKRKPLSHESPTSPNMPLSETINASGCDMGFADLSLPIDEEVLEIDDDDAFEPPITPLGVGRVQDLPAESAARSFCGWLNRRRPLWRFDANGNGVAWDFPQSKTEKRELLLLNVLAEGEELKSENYDRKIEQEALLNEVEMCNMELDKYRQEVHTRA